MKILQLNTLLLFCLLQNAFSQVTGKITDINGQPIPYVNVLLLNSSDTSLIKGTLTDENGAYQIENILQGSYFLRLSSVGFQTRDYPSFELSIAQSNKDFGIYTLKEDSKQLDEVVIRGEKPLYRQETGGMVVNVENSILTKGSSALQVLERSPGIMIDRQNNTIALNGKNDVMVMVNGKIIRMPVTQVVTLLNGMSADNIEKIELLTTPPSRYDADGNAGMINIITKQNEDFGMKGSLSLTGGYGMGEKTMGTMNINHSNGSINLYGSYSYSHDKSFYNWHAEGEQNMPSLGGQLDAKFWSATTPVQDNHNATLGIEAALNAKTTIGSSLSYNNSLISSSILNRGEYTIGQGSFLLMDAEILGENRWKNMIANMFFEKKIKEGEKINFDIDYLYYYNTNPTDVYSSISNGENNEAEMNNSFFAARQRGAANTPIQVGVAKFDYIKQLGKNIKLEAGIKGTYTLSSSSSNIESLINDDWISSPRTSIDMEMQEKIGAAYSTFNYQINPSTSLIAGARYEYSDTRMDAEKEENKIDRRFGKMFPGVFLSRQLNDKSNMQLSYTKRISRPSYNDLASFITYNDPVSVFTGNPSLRPVITNNLKLGYQYNGYSFAVLLSRDDHPISRYQLTKNPAGDLMYVSPQNLAYQNNMNFETNIPFKINNWWSMNNGFVGGWRQFKLLHTAEKIEKTYFAYSLFGSQNFQLPKSFTLEISGFYNSASYNGSVKVDGFGMLNAGMKKELPNNLGGIQFSVSDIFKTMNIMNYYGELTEEPFSLSSFVSFNTESRNSRVFSITYSKSFGNNKLKGQRDRGIGSKDERDRIRKN